MYGSRALGKAAAWVGLSTLLLFAPLAMQSAYGPSSPIVPNAHAYAAEESAADFIKRLGEKAIGALTDSGLDPQVRRDRFRDLLREGIDLEYVGRFVLGAYRRRVDEEQMETFLALLEDNIVKNYAWRFRNYNGQELEIVRVAQGPRDTTIVQSVLHRLSDAPPIKVDWRLHRRDGTFRVIDISVEGISMMVTQRDEYVGFMRTNGGIDALIEALRKQNAALVERSENG